jgi:hypothetical protein
MSSRPNPAAGIPKCYFSLGLAAALITPFLFHLAKSGGSTAKHG